MYIIMNVNYKVCAYVCVCVYDKSVYVYVWVVCVYSSMYVWESECVSICMKPDVFYHFNSMYPKGFYSENKLFAFAFANLNIFTKPAKVDFYDFEVLVLLL